MQEYTSTFIPATCYSLSLFLSGERWRWRLPCWTWRRSGELFFCFRFWWCRLRSQQVLVLGLAWIVWKIWWTHSDLDGACRGRDHFRKTSRSNVKKTWTASRTRWNWYYQGRCWWLGLSFSTSFESGRMATKSVACWNQSVVSSWNCSLAEWLHFGCRHNNKSAWVELCIFTSWRKWWEASFCWLLFASLVGCCWIWLCVDPCGVRECRFTPEGYFRSSWAVVIIAQYGANPKHENIQNIRWSIVSILLRSTMYYMKFLHTLNHSDWKVQKWRDGYFCHPWYSLVCCLKTAYQGCDL